MTNLDRVVFLVCFVGLISSSILLGQRIEQDAPAAQAAFAALLTAMNAGGVLAVGLKER